MAASISLKLPEDLLKASGRYADALQLTRAAYIRRALEQMEPRDPRPPPGASAP